MFSAQIIKDFFPRLYSNDYISDMFIFVIGQQRGIDKVEMDKCISYTTQSWSMNNLGLYSDYMESEYKCYSTHIERVRTRHVRELLHISDFSGPFLTFCHGAKLKLEPFP